MIKTACLLAVLLVAGVYANDTYKYAGVLMGATESLAPTFDSTTGACSTGSATTPSVSFTVNVTAPGAYFVQAMFEKSIVSGATVRVLSAANVAATPCAGLVRGGTSKAGKAPHVHYVVQFTTVGIYYVYVQSAATLATDKSGIFAVHLYPALAFVDTSAVNTTWLVPDDYDTDTGACTSGDTQVNYASASWAFTGVSGYYDAYIIYETGNSSSNSAGLSLYESATGVAPANFSSLEFAFDACSNTSTTVMKDYVSTGNANMGLTYGVSATAIRFMATNGSTYYFAFGAENSHYVGKIALRVEPSRFGSLDTSATADFVQPTLSTETCTEGPHTHYGVYTFTPEAGEYVFVIDTGYSEFDAVGSLYIGNNTAVPPASCPVGWVMTVDIGDISPLATYPLIPGQLNTAVVGVYNGGSASSAGKLFQLFAMGGSYIGPAVPGVVAPNPPGTDVPSSASAVAISALIALAALLALLL